MTALLEERGLVVIQGDLPKPVECLTCRVECEGREPVEVIVVSRSGDIERRRFGLAHEIAHRVLVDTAIAGRQHESSMNRFAGAFLIQPEHLMGSVGKGRSAMTSSEIFRLKKGYGVPAAAMLMRLGQVGILPQGVVAKAFKTFARSWMKEEPEPMEHLEGFAAFEQPRCFERLVWQALGERLIIPLRAARLLGIPLKEVETMLEG
ncbi:ImmA/IrrE family metallo-endopeptidase [Thioalkalivibrio sp. HK1]|uniref:ImmA/IrrE family metallo-endopeptidase n=1 Tax=Thioalkalivibrio sp. HK1 TaxID=1469245 RepID=UPI0004B1567F|nr:ImmA/IrrE family metallo-endopeptidase [Thioalkalivibrio sp. HK1]